jgi:hypothetical protein
MKLPLGLLCAVVACGCQPTGPSSVPPAKTSTFPPPANPFDQFGGLPVAEPSVSKQLTDLKLRVQEMEMASRRAGWAEEAKYQATLDPTAKGFTVIETSLGRFLLADTEVTPYLDGYSVRFKVGNLLAATLTGCKITARWGPPYVRGTNDLRTAMAATEKQWRTNNFDIPDVFYSGLWTPLELKIVPADSASIRNLSIELQPTTVNMREVKK